MAELTEKVKSKNYIKAAAVTFISYLLTSVVVIVYAVINRSFIGRTAFTYTAAFLSLFAVYVTFYILIYFMCKSVYAYLKNMIALSVILAVSIAFNLTFGAALSVYFRPFALAGLLAVMLLGKRAGLITQMQSGVILLIADVFFVGGDTARLALIDILIGCVASAIYMFMISGVKKRLSTIFISLQMMFVMGVLAIIVQISLGFDLTILYSGLWAAGSALITNAMFIMILPIFEYSFNFITDFRLFELTDHNNKLLVELSQKAPGTFNHSIVVANLAEACASAIGENSNLARAAAYYHDIGKLNNVVYFRENQGSNKNPHDDITPEVSVEIIKNHVSNGVKRAKENHLPNEIIDAIKEHHGTLPIKVFYYKALKYTDGDLGLSTFSYDGPKPRSRISAILMIADAAEAAARVLTDRNEKNVEKVVSDIIEERIALNQFTDCNITFAEIYTIGDVIIKTLSGVYHERIKYPDIKFYEKKDGGEQDAESDI